MDYLTWYYSDGLKFYLDGWFSAYDWVNHYLSPVLLLQTMFSPWKRMIVVDKEPGFNFKRFFENFTFNFVSRFIGAAVRFILLWAGIAFMILTIIGGISGFLLWIFIPVFGFSVYNKYKRQPQNYVYNLLSGMNSKKEQYVKHILDNAAGKFLLARMGLELQEAVENADETKIDFKKLKAKSYEELIKKLVEKKMWPQTFFNKRGIKDSDMVLVASWWDKKQMDENKFGGRAKYGRPGLALDMVYGYTPTLNRYSVDLSAPQSYSHRLIGRQPIVNRMERTLTSGVSVLLVGQPGVGKKTVVLEFAHRAVSGQFGPKMTFKRVLELDYNTLLSETKDLNKKKTKLAQVLMEALSAGNVILMVRDIHRLTNNEVEGYNFTDIFEEYLSKKDLKIIAVSTNDDYERFVSQNMRLRKYLERVEVIPPTKDEAMQILIDAAHRWERLRGFVITIMSLRKILDESDRYVTEVPFPEKALEILDSVVTYCEQKGKTTIEAEDAGAVLSEKTGISFAKLSGDEKKQLGKIEETIHKRLIDQKVAVKLIGQTLRAKTVGVVSENRPLGSFLFLGPTGVGKTETAKVLAKVYYGSTENILRFDMAEYSGSEGLERLIGSISNNQPGVLTTAIKNRPASLLLLDEMEKASQEISNLFLALLDEGMITDAFGKRVSARHLFVIGTSNAGAEYIRQLVDKGVKGEELQKSVVNHIMEKRIYSPEFLNRFDGVVVYEPLGKDDLIKIAHLMFDDLAENLEKKNIYLSVADGAAEKLAEDGYEPAFGARPMRRIVNIVLGDLLGKAIIEGEIKEGDKVQIVPGTKKEEFNWKKVS